MRNHNDFADMRRRSKTMRCDELKGLLDLYLDDELPEEQSRKIERHLLRCPACGGELRALEQTRAMMREAIARAEPSPAFRERASARLLAAFSTHLRPAQEMESARQWSLPFPKTEP
jgi:anti-sigma factor RsiW